MTRFDFSLATQADDAQLRERMAHDWIQGAAAISLRREPSYFDACRLQGDSVQVLTGRERASGRIVVMGSRCITTTFVNGRPERTAHLADLRIHPDYRSGTLLARTYRYLRTLHEADPLPCFTLIYDDNATALNSLVGGRAGLPTYLPRGRLVAPAIHLAKCRPELTVSGVELRRARPDELPAIVEFLNRHRADHLWAPVLSIDDFRPGGRCGTLQAKDFFLALRQGRVCATLATWDQSSLRQAHVERYASPTAWLRPGYNLMARLRGLPRLPTPGKALPYLYLAFIAVEDDSAILFRALLRHVHNALCCGRWLYALAALHESDPLSDCFADYHVTSSLVRLYEVDYGGAIGSEPGQTGNVRAGVEFALT
ncbi:hypothetical protein [Paraburkholderia youngii]|uniref:hypothetical protein n=1 Tax=Paraburkholderia youngii TaxID=2782701 RepID=UPI003D21E008